MFFWLVFIQNSTIIILRSNPILPVLIVKTFKIKSVTILSF